MRHSATTAIAMLASRRAALLSLSLLALHGAADAAGQPFALTIGPGKVGEVCMALAAGDLLTWQFKASRTLDFNLHHHRGNQVLMPIDRKAVMADRGQHRIDQRNDWCLMWTAPPGGEPVALEGAWSTLPAAAAASSATAK